MHEHYSVGQLWDLELGLWSIMFTLFVSFRCNDRMKMTKMLLKMATIASTHTNTLILEFSVKFRQLLNWNFGARHWVTDPTRQQKRWSLAHLWKWKIRKLIFSGCDMHSCWVLEFKRLNRSLNTYKQCRLKSFNASVSTLPKGLFLRSLDMENLLLQGCVDWNLKIAKECREMWQYLQLSELF